MTAHGKLQLADLQRLMDDATRRNASTRRPGLDTTSHPVKTLGTLLGVEIALLLLFRYLREIDAGSLMITLTLMLIALFGALTLVTIAAVWFRYATPRQLAKQPGVLGPRSYTIEADGLRITTETSDVVTSWDDITEVRTDADYAFVYMGKLVGPVIPRRFFADNAAFEAFADELRSRADPE